MHGCRGILAHHMVAKVDTRKPDELRDVQGLHMAESGKSSADGGKQRANGNENVAPESVSCLIGSEIFDGRVNSTATKKGQGVGVEQGSEHKPDQFHGP